MFLTIGAGIDSDRLTVKGRCALRRWYRFERAGGRSRSDARTVVGLMAHAAIMGDFWVCWNNGAVD